MALCTVKEVLRLYRAKKLCMTGILLLTFCIAGCAQKSGMEINDGSEPQRTEKASEKEKICVYVCGSVKNPGVYELPEDARIVSAIALAGGFTKDASAAGVNQAERIKDGQQIYVPSKKEAGKKEDTSSPTGGSGTQDKRVNLNSASREELMTLTGIGEAKASDIISYREENGGFEKPEDIMKIRGIKQGIYRKIKDMITV